MVGASAVGVLGGIIACTAQSMNTLIAANIFMGLSGGVHTCYGLTVGEICPNKYKFVGITLCVVPSIICTGFGAYIGEFATNVLWQRLIHGTAQRLVYTGAGWRWCYYSYIMMMTLACAMQYLFYNPPSFSQLHGGERTIVQEIKRIDFVGALLMTIGMTLFLLGVSWGKYAQA